MSSVLRVAVSYVRMPRSHSTTSWLPLAMMYSAAIKSSLIVAERPRLSSTGRRTRPSSASSAKFCMLRAPTWSMSACSATRSTWRVSITSVTTGNPVSARTSASSSQRFDAESLEGVGRRARLVRAAAEHRRAGSRHRVRRGDEHLAALDRTRPGDDGERVAAEAGVRLAAADVHDGALDRELARRELVRLEHRRDRFDAGERTQRQLGQERLVADASDDRALLAARQMRAHPGGLDALADMVDLGVGDVGFRDDDHWRFTWSG